MNFRLAKREKCIFGSTFRPRKKIFFLIFPAFSGRTQRNLRIPEGTHFFWIFKIVFRRTKKIHICQKCIFAWVLRIMSDSNTYRTFQHFKRAQHFSIHAWPPIIPSRTLKGGVLEVEQANFKIYWMKIIKNHWKSLKKFIKLKAKYTKKIWNRPIW